MRGWVSPMATSKKYLTLILPPRPGATGLGLTTSYSIIRNHNGVIIVDSELGRGSVFSFILPAADLSMESANDQEKPQPRGNSKILVMDDDDAVRTVISRLLQGYGYKVQCTATGDETITAYKNAFGDGEAFAVVIMDLTIPGGVGGQRDGKSAAGNLIRMSRPSCPADIQTIR